MPITRTWAGWMHLDRLEARRQAGSTWAGGKHLGRQAGSSWAGWNLTTVKPSRHDASTANFSLLYCSLSDLGTSDRLLASPVDQRAGAMIGQQFEQHRMLGLAVENDHSLDA
jgi:hypothetical protein